MYELWKKDHQVPWTNPLWRELNRLIAGIIEVWPGKEYWDKGESYIIGYWSVWKLDWLSRERFGGIHASRRETWTRIHEIFDTLEIPEPIRREYCKEVYFSNKLNNK